MIKTPKPNRSPQSLSDIPVIKPSMKKGIANILVNYLSFRLSCRILPTYIKAVKSILYKQRFQNIQSYHRVLKERSGLIRHSAYRLHLEEQHPRNNRSQTNLGCSVIRTLTSLLLRSPVREQRSSVEHFERATLITKYSQQPKLNASCYEYFVFKFKHAFNLISMYQTHNRKSTCLH